MKIVLWIALAIIGYFLVWPVAGWFLNFLFHGMSFLFQLVVTVVILWLAMTIGKLLLSRGG